MVSLFKMCVAFIKMFNVKGSSHHADAICMIIERRDDIQYSAGPQVIFKAIVDENLGGVTEVSIARSFFTV
jgi:hypothetical protein